MRAVTYLRFSHDKQAKGFSIEEQTEACLKMALHDKAEIVTDFIDRAQSAKTSNRPALVEMITFVCNPRNNIDVLYVYDTSRLSRNQIDFSIIKKQLSESGVTIRPVMGVASDTIEGNLVQDLLARVAEFKNDIDAVKVKGGMHSRFKAGYALKPVRGYKWGKNEQGKSIIVPDETFELYQALWHKIKNEKLTIVGAVKYINKFLPKSKLTRTSLSRMLSNKLYYGVLQYPAYGTDEVQGKHTPMIDEDTFLEVRSIIDGRNYKHVKTRNKVNPLYPLTKSLKCPHCGGKITAARSKGKTKHFEYYFCRQRGACNYNKQVSDVHNAFLDKLSSLKPTPELMQFIREMIKEKYESYYNDLTASSKDIERDLSQLVERKATIQEKLFDGVISNEDYKQAVLKVESEIIAKKSLISEKQLDKLDIETIINYVEFYMTNIDKIWLKFDIEVRIAVQSSTFPEGVVYDENTCRTPLISPAFVLNEMIKESYSMPLNPNAHHSILMSNTLNEAMNNYIMIYKQFSHAVPMNLAV